VLLTPAAIWPIVMLRDETHRLSDGSDLSQESFDLGDDDIGSRERSQVVAAGQVRTPLFTTDGMFPSEHLEDGQR
jgi:hypothetical protein